MAAWVPLCMDMAEHAAWMAANQRLVGSSRVARPCHDCPLGFAAEMRAIGRCNGTPGGVEEDDDMDQGNVETVVEQATRRVSIAVAAPCEGCSHQVVCRIAEEVAAVGRAQVPVPKLGQGLAMTLSASIECEFFAPMKRPKAPASDRPKREMTPEQREAARQRMLHARAVGVAKKAAEA